MIVLVLIVVAIIWLAPILAGPEVPYVPPVPPEMLQEYEPTCWPECNAPDADAYYWRRDGPRRT